MNRVPDWYERWYQHLQARGPAMSDRQLEAAARLAVVLLCGEQSATHIFAAEIQRSTKRGYSQAVGDLVGIERDEVFHEHALARFCDWLPATTDQHQLKRRAQKFFAGLARANNLSQQFIKISQLDTAVCKIMWHIERSELESLSPLRLLATRIKLDEARHVAVSRRYARAMGYSKRVEADDHAQLRHELVQMLDPLGASFEEIGVDPDRLFASVHGHS
jgi:hypothetical protein